MDEALFDRLAALLAVQPVVVADVVETRGATPRKRGSRMLITAQSSEFSIGGGVAEMRVTAAARALLADDARQGEVAIDLSGQIGAAGVCGGRMHVSLRRWCGPTDLAQAQEIRAQLCAGKRVVLDVPGAVAADVTASRLSIAMPDVRLLIVGAGHCGMALYDIAQHLSFDIWMHDTRTSCFTAANGLTAHILCGEVELLEEALQTEREVYAVLLNRDFQTDIAALRVLCGRRPDFLAMMGSRRRVDKVLLALAEHEPALRGLVAPVGLDIGAQTPHEIAISILAQLIQRRSQDRNIAVL
ncbi:MAG: XdhC family protein [Tahibacter sp.]